MPSIRRRALLVGGASALAGCGFSVTSSDQSGGDTPTPTETTRQSPSATPTPTSTQTHQQTETPTHTPDTPVRLTPGEEYETSAGWSVTLHTVRIQRYVVQHGTAHPRHRWQPDAQFATAAVTVSGTDDPGPTDLDLAVEADVVEGRSDRLILASDESTAGTERLGFPVPFSPPPTTGAFVWRRSDGPTVRWEFSPEHLDVLARPPEFEVREVTAPERVAADTEFPVTLAIANVGERDGTFRGGLGLTAMSAPPLIAVDVPAGTTRETTRSVRAHFGDSATLTVRLTWGDWWDKDELTRTVQRESSSR